MTAAEAKEKSLETITKLAKEYITNKVEPKIEEVTRYGTFHCTVNHPYHSKQLRTKVADLLKAQGFKVKIADNFYDISWEE
jgi:hypothetical protein